MTRSLPLSRRTRWLACCLGLLTGALSVLLLGVAATTAVSLSGWGYAVGAAVFSAGLLSLPWRSRPGLTRAGLGVLLLVAGTRLLLVGGDTPQTLRVPDGGHRWVNRLVDERDGTLLVARVLLLADQLPRTDARDVVPALEAAFDRLQAAEGAVPTPAVATYLGLQSPESFDAVVIPAEGPASDVAVVFLHGYAGNFAVYCWQMSRSARAISALTICPSVGPRGDWWSRQGEETLERTLAWLQRRGIRRVYLAGLSNGGAGASVIAERVSPPGMELQGLVLISGAWMKSPTPRVPTLLVQGRHDSMMPARTMRAYAERAGARATYVELDSGHFAFFDRHEECEQAITSWLLQRERKPRA